TFLFWKINGAIFVDAGNIWTLREYDEQPGGQFKINELYKQMAVAYGVGLRLNFDYFILRFDLGMKAVNPAYENRREHYPLLYPDFSRDYSFHFAVGLPF
ncbi:MAG: BamA/TamA family outer membrane protein, partial [Prevotella sp.]|nr:BamA/TamA family outer membrane protein [Prevotella sp.]